MTADDLFAILPLLVVGATTVVVMLVVAYARRHVTAFWATLGGLALALALVPLAAGFSPRAVTPLLMADGYSAFVTVLVLAATIATALLAYGYLEGREAHRGELYHGEFYILLLSAALGALVLAGASHFISLFLGLELISISLFALVGYPVNVERPLEAAVKYLVLSGVSSAFLLFGIALIYAALGTLSFAALPAALQEAPLGATPYLLVGAVLLLVGLGFKLSLVPFHMWTPDVYEGAPAPVGAFLATVSKGAVFAVLLRYLLAGHLLRHEGVEVVVATIAVASMLIGNLLALLQENVKRILGYSSIAHLGYLLVALLAAPLFGAEAVVYYLAAYFVMMIGAFGVVTALSGVSGEEADALERYRGLFWHRPWLAAAFTVVLLALAGIPLTVGFIGKFYLFTAGVDAQLWLPVAVLVAGSVIGLYYYLRIIVTMAGTPQSAPPVSAAGEAAWSHAVVVAVVTLLVLWLGIFPNALIQWAHAAYL